MAIKFLRKKKKQNISAKIKLKEKKRSYRKREEMLTQIS